MLLDVISKDDDTKPRQEKHQTNDSEKKLHEQNESVKADERYESSIIIVIRVRRGNFRKALAERCAISTSNPAMLWILPQYEN
jgi:hypothetical protein